MGRKWDKEEMKRLRMRCEKEIRRKLKGGNGMIRELGRKGM